MMYNLLATGLMALLGLAFGSFLNVLIHRLPLMIEQSWQASEHDGQTLNLATPASHCPKCQHAIAWHDNLPLLSFVWLRGHCRHCQARISWQYPAVELATAVLFVWSLLAHGDWPSSLAWAGFASALLALAVIDARTTWLPDAITQPLTWGGLVAAGLGLTGVPLQTALAGAVAGYLSLWLIYWAFLLTTGKEGMGYGDFKLLAALGAWFGWHPLLALVLIASLSALAFGLVMMWRKGLTTSQPMPFGPFLALAGAWQLFAGSPAPLLL